MARELNYKEALALLRAHNANESLVKHGIGGVGGNGSLRAQVWRG